MIQLLACTNCQQEWLCDAADGAMCPSCRKGMLYAKEKGTEPAKYTDLLRLYLVLDSKPVEGKHRV